MGILVNQNQIGGGASNSSHNIGDIFYTTRTDNSLNGAVECNGSQYNFSDFDSNLQALFDDGKLPYLPISEFDSMVTNQGGCDSFGYGISNMVKIYPIGNDTEPAQMYIELTDQQFESFYTTLDQCNKGDILPYRLYDIDTKELLEGYYIKCTGTGFFQAYDNNNEEFGYFVDVPFFNPEKVDGEWVYYETIPDPDKSQASPTTYFKVPKKLGRVLVRSQKPTADNNYTWYNVYADGWVEQGGKKEGVINNTDYVVTFPVEMAELNYTYTLGQSLTAADIWSERHAMANFSTKTTTGISIKNLRFAGTTAKSMEICWQVSGYATSSEYAQSTWEYQNVQVERPMVQLFNGATDEALATCTEVLADVAGLKQTTDGMIDYVIESQEPTADNGYTWYRLYKSGWVEQGGKQYMIVPGNSQTVRTAISLPIEMNNANYNTQLTQEQIKGAITLAVAKRYEGATQDPSTQTTLSIISINNKDGDYTTPVNYMWQVSGMSAQGSN